MMEQIDRDVMRTHPDMHFFSGDGDVPKGHREVSYCMKDSHAAIIIPADNAVTCQGTASLHNWEFELNSTSCVYRP